MYSILLGGVEEEVLLMRAFKEQQHAHSFVSLF
jgi:hypothetical protein